MGATTKYALPYPEQTDPPDGPTQIRALADKLDPLVLAMPIADAKGDLLVGTANDAIARLGVGADGTVLTADASQASGMRWAGLPGGGATVTYGTNPPASPNTGDIWQFPADAASGTIWVFRYNAASASAYKWEFIGGTDLYARVDTDESTTVISTWLDLTTIGPRIVVPRAGDYDSIGSANFYGSAGGMSATLGPTVGATSGDFNAGVYSPAANASAQAVSVSRQTGVAAGADVRLRYYSFVAGSAHFRGRWLRVRPIRVS